MTMTAERLAELDAVMAKATAGEWEWRNDQLLPLSDQWTISPGVLIADSNNGTPGGDEIDRANAAAIVALHNAYPDLRAHIVAQAATIAALQAFKDYVHERLDAAGIPTHPDGRHSVAGCRIGDRLDIALDAQAATIARLKAELEKTTHPHFWWDVDDSENGCDDDITSILENHEIGEVVELSCARKLPNQWAVGYVTESGGFRGQTFATEVEAVAFAAERAALTGAAA